MNTIYITTEESGAPTGASQYVQPGAYAAPFTSTGTTWALGLKRVYVAFDGIRVVAAFGTREDADAYKAATGNDDIGRTILDNPKPRRAWRHDMKTRTNRIYTTQLGHQQDGEAIGVRIITRHGRAHIAVSAQTCSYGAILLIDDVATWIDPEALAEIATNASRRFYGDLIATAHRGNVCRTGQYWHEWEAVRAHCGASVWMTAAVNRISESRARRLLTAQATA